LKLDEFERTVKSLSPMRAVLFFLFRPSAFKSLCLRHDFADSVLREGHIQSAVLAGTLSGPDARDEELVELRTSELRKGLGNAGFFFLGSGLLSAVIGVALFYKFGASPAWLSSILQMSGVGIILWATLWELGWHVRSFGGHTLPERVHQWLFRTMYCIGSACFFLAYAWATNW